MTTGPDGQDMPVGQRLAEIIERYGPDHLVSRAITQVSARTDGRRRARHAASLMIIERRLVTRGTDDRRPSRTWPTRCRIDRSIW